MKHIDQEIKEYLSDILIEGIINIVKSGYNNPVSNFFSNILIIEGPTRLKNELFAAFYEYVDSTAELNKIMSSLVNILIGLTYDYDQYKDKADKFKTEKSTALTFFFYDIIIVYAKNNDIYLSSYDFIQPDSTMINSPESMDPVYISTNYKEALEKDL